MKSPGNQNLHGLVNCLAAQRKGKDGEALDRNGYVQEREVSGEEWTNPVRQANQGKNICVRLRQASSVNLEVRKLGVREETGGHLNL